MTRRQRFLPSAGFVLLLLSYVLLVLFLAWGYSRPDLDRAWYILQKMQREEFAGLDASDARTLETLVRQYPRFSHALIGNSLLGFAEPVDDDGWVSLPESHLVIQPLPAAELEFVVECRAERAAFALRVTLETQGARETLEFSEAGQKTVDWSKRPLTTPAWVRVSVEPAKTRTQVGSNPEVRVRLAHPEPREAKP